MLISAMTLHGMVSVATGTPSIGREGGGKRKANFASMAEQMPSIWIGLLL